MVCVCTQGGGGAQTFLPRGIYNIYPLDNMIEAPLGSFFFFGGGGILKK